MFRQALSPSVARDVIATLEKHVKARRVDKMKSVLAQRRADIELVVENLADESNAVRSVAAMCVVWKSCGLSLHLCCYMRDNPQGAVMRTADVLGIQVRRDVIIVCWPVVALLTSVAITTLQTVHV